MARPPSSYRGITRKGSHIHFFKGGTHRMVGKTPNKHRGRSFCVRRGSDKQPTVIPLGVQIHALGPIGSRLRKQIVAFLGDKMKRGNSMPVHINENIFTKETKITWILVDTTTEIQLLQTPGIRNSLIQTATPTSSVPLSTTQAV